MKLIYIALLTFTSALFALDKPDVMLAKVFQGNENIAEYWVSEKLDGVRARWDGKQLISRGGIMFNAPVWFTQGFPRQIMDGELWLARGEYQRTMSIVRRNLPHEGWRNIRFQIFDLPKYGGVFSARVQAMRELSTSSRSPYLQVITQQRFSSKPLLLNELERINALGGEGLMLHHQDALYRSGRSRDILKLKTRSDAEATVLAYRAGKGRFSGKMGAVQVRDTQGKVFYIGSGFSQTERENPPKIGQMITFRYQGFTKKGIPRFAVFLRVRDK